MHSRNKGGFLLVRYIAQTDPSNAFKNTYTYKSNTYTQAPINSTNGDIDASLTRTPWRRIAVTIAICAYKKGMEMHSRKGTDPQTRVVSYHGLNIDRIATTLCGRGVCVGKYGTLT